jgi:hypothetical protein
MRSACLVSRIVLFDARSNWRRMRELSTASGWRGLLTYAAMSLLVTWHTFAMVVAAAPHSMITDAARSLINPYLVLLNLDNHWDFFDEVGTSQQFRYVVEDAAGQKHLFIPTDSLNRLGPNSIWLADHYREVMNAVDLHGDATAAQLCRDHAALRPVAVTLLEVMAKPFHYQDRRSGKHPLDPEFVTVNALKTVPCPTR